MRRLSFFPVLLLALLALSGGCKKAATDGVPGFSLKTYDGKEQTFVPNDGTVRLVVFWATWCVPCIEEIPQLKDFHKRFADRGFRVIAINIDDPVGETAPTLMRQFEMNYPVWVEVDETAEKAFGGLRALPTSFIVGRDGSIKKKLEGLYPPETLEQLIVKEL